MTKKQKVIALIAFVLIIVLIALICVSLQNKRDSGTTDDTRTSAAPSESLEPTPEPTPTPLQFTTAPEGYFNDALFIGDSRMVGIQMMETIDGATFFTTVGLSLTGAMSTSADVSGVGTTTLPALLQSRPFGKVYVMLGINELGWYNLDKFIEYYGNIVDLLRETHPEAQIYIISILPVGAKATASQEMLNNDRVQMFNERIQGMCSEKQVYFVNGFEALAVNGSLPDDASPDGVHMQPSYCHKLTDYLLTHTVSA